MTGRRAVIGFILIPFLAFGCRSQGTSKKDGLARLDLEYGFAGIPFDTPMNDSSFQFKNARLRDSDDGTKMLSLDHPQNYKGVELASLVFVFKDEKFVSVFMSTRNKKGAQTMLERLQEDYGKGSRNWIHKLISDDEVRSWLGKKVSALYIKAEHDFGANVSFYKKDYIDSLSGSSRVTADSLRTSKKSN